MRDNKKVEPIKEDAKEKVEPTKTAERKHKKNKVSGFFGKASQEAYPIHII